jgi:hypothetical protein
VIRKIILVSMIGIFMMTGCENKLALEEKARRASEPPATSAVAKMEFGKSKPFQETESKRYIAVRYHFTVETSEAGLEKAWESMIGFCENIHCDIMESTINKKTPYSPPSGNIVLRVLPENLKPLMEHIHKVGKVVSQNTESEDKTTTVIDVEAKIKNTTEFRNRLRSMLTTRTGTLKDVVEVEKELSKVQSELDSLVASRKALANETEKIAVTIDFRPEPSVAETGAFAPIASAWHQMGRVFAGSIAAILTFIVAVIPWLVLIIPGLWFLPKLFRKVFRKVFKKKEPRGLNK